MTYSQWCENEIGYKTITTYWEDMSIAERFGKSAMVDTVDRAIKFDGDYKSLTELCLVLNHKIWFNYEKNRPLAEIYNKLWEKVDNYLVNKLKGDELRYFYRVTD